MDTDNDGLLDGWEYVYGLNPIKNDTDGDGITDGWEVRYGFDATNANDALQDADSDGLTNIDEFRIGTDPLDEDTDNDGIIDGADPYPMNWFLPYNILYLIILTVLILSFAIAIWRIWRSAMLEKILMECYKLSLCDLLQIYSKASTYT